MNKMEGVEKRNASKYLKENRKKEGKNLNHKTKKKRMKETEKDIEITDGF